MGYVVFARKWRPATFEDVVGQSHITDTLKRAISKDRVAHAYIFSGTRGVGKTTTARILARALNCENGPTTDPCGVCESCKSIASGNSFDVMEIDGASNNGVDQIRELRDSVGYTSLNGKYRVFVIDEVHMLTTGAFNALLKTLEEPPENVIFIFATTEPNKIPDTIHSRCQQFEFRTVSGEHLSGHLKRICTKENIAFEEGALNLIAHKANGSVRDSLSLLEQAYSFCGDELREKEVRSVLGLVERDVYITIMKAVRIGDSKLVVEILDAVLSRGYDLAEFLSGFLEYLRSLLFLSIPGGASLVKSECEEDVQIAAEFSEGDLLRMCEQAKNCEKEMRFSTLPRFYVELLLVKLATMDRTVTLAAIVEAMQSGEMKLPEPSDHSSFGVVEMPESLKYRPEPVVSDPVVSDPVVPEPVVPEPVVSEPVVSEPVVSESVVSESVVPEPVVSDPVVSEPVVPEPVVPEPVVPDPVVSDPVVSDPVVPEPVVPEPVVPEPVVPEPVVPEPVVPEPVVPEPVVPEPVVSEPVVSEPVVSEPVVSEPVVSEPVVPEPVVPESVVSESVVSEPVVPDPEFLYQINIKKQETEADEDRDEVVVEAPVVAEEQPEFLYQINIHEHAPIAEAPMSEASMSEASMSEASMSEASMSEASMSEAPMSEAPMSEAPMSEAPMSEAPMSEAPIYSDVKQYWGRYIEAVSQKKPILGSWLELGVLTEVDGDSADVRFSPVYSFQQMELGSDENRRFLENELSAFAGRKMGLHMTVADAPVVHVPQSEVVAPQAPVQEVVAQEPIQDPGVRHHMQSLKDEIKKEPIIEKVIEIFNGEIL